MRMSKHTINSKKYEMENNYKGVVMFAYNSHFDYVSMANLAAALVKKFLDVPVTLITNVDGEKAVDYDVIETVMIHDSTGTNNRVFRLDADQKHTVVNWKNLTRADAYFLSPYSQTILMDCDYLVYSKYLKNLFDTEVDFTCFKHVHDVTNQKSFASDRRVARYAIPMLWATVVYFRKSKFAEAIFSMMKSIQDNYDYYAKLYGFPEAPYRNDFALSIAHHALSGYNSFEHHFIPAKLMTLPSQAKVVDFRQNGNLLFQYQTSDKQAVNVLNGVDLHVMDKGLLDDQALANRMMAYAKSK